MRKLICRIKRKHKFTTITEQNEATLTVGDNQIEVCFYRLAECVRCKRLREIALMHIDVDTGGYGDLLVHQPLARDIDRLEDAAVWQTEGSE